MGQNMIRHLQRRFVAIATLIILLILVFVIGCINGINALTNSIEVSDMLRFISDNAGIIPPQMNEPSGKFTFRVNAEMPYETRYFSVITDDKGHTLHADYDHIASVTSDEAEHMMRQVMDSRRATGRITDDNSFYAYMSRDLTAQEAKYMGYDNATLTVFLDFTKRRYQQMMLLHFSASLGLLSLLIFFLLVSAFSKRAIRPTIAAYEKQREFITNAGHELKTPLAIISANTEVIEMTSGKTEWTTSTIEQVKRLSTLVSRLITIAKLDEASPDQIDVTQDIDLSAVTKELITTFTPLVMQAGKNMTYSIDDNIHINGDSNSVRELFSILLDNAVKYCDDNGTIHLDLHLSRGKRAVCSITNTYAEGDGIDYSRFFDRFYRGEESHNSEKSGFGIGLSMAQSIVKIHKGRISADWKDGNIIFTVTMQT